MNYDIIEQNLDKSVYTFKGVYPSTKKPVKPQISKNSKFYKKVWEEYEQAQKKYERVFNQYRAAKNAVENKFLDDLNYMVQDSLTCSKDQAEKLIKHVTQSTYDGYYDLLEKVYELILLIKDLALKF